MFTSESAQQVRERRQKGRRESSAAHVPEKEQRAHMRPHAHLVVGAHRRAPGAAFLRGPALRGHGSSA